MKKIIVFLLMTASVFTLSAQVTSTSPGESDGKHVLNMGDVSMTIDANQGGKILSYKYKDQEIISQSPRREAFGSTFWTSPQKEWNWPPVPEYDKNPYTVDECSDSHLLMTSQVSERMKYRIRKEFTVDATNNAILVTYTIINESDETRQVAPWEITRVANDGGLIFFDAPLDGITPAGLLSFEAKDGAVWYRSDEAPQNRKINADGKGWLAYCSNGLLMVKQFEDLTPTQPAPGEAEIQVYVNMRKTYIELESQGAYTTLEPGGQLHWTVRWSLIPYNGECIPSKALVKTVKKVIKGKKVKR
ncbi:MAG: hypothetical protein IKX22_12855 [Prevotella sp.]|nr:hypothetical protein [Prevotella sp.]